MPHRHQTFSMRRTATKVYKGIVVAPEQRYSYLASNTDWEDGIYSYRRRKVSRLAYIHDQIGDNEVDRFLEKMISNAIKAITDYHKKEGTKNPIEGLVSLGTYVNYYRDGNDFCPAHSHKGQIQLVISLGATRPLKVGTKTFDLESGDVIVFGSSTHSIDIDPTITEGRISIATFMEPQ